MAIPQQNLGGAGTLGAAAGVAPPAPPAPDGGMAPSTPVAPSEAEQTQIAVENLNIAEASAMEALEAAQINPAIGPETEQKIEQAVVLLDEAKNEIAAPAPDAGVVEQGGGVLGSGAEV